MPNVVIDASTIVSAALKADSVPERALLIASIYDVICLSDAIIDEIQSVLARPKFARFVTESRRRAILRVLLADARLVDPVETVTDCRDRKDNKYIEAALAADAGVVISGDSDLLELDPWRGTRIMRPAEYVAHIELREKLASTP